MAVGTRLHHPAHGLGRLELVDAHEPRNKPYKVRFDRGESHHYDIASLKKMETVGDDGRRAPIELVVLSAADASGMLAGMPLLRPHVSTDPAEAAGSAVPWAASAGSPSPPVAPRPSQYHGPPAAVAPQLSETTRSINGDATGAARACNHDEPSCAQGTHGTPGALHALPADCELVALQLALTGWLASHRSDGPSSAHAALGRAAWMQTVFPSRNGAGTVDRTTWMDNVLRRDARDPTRTIAIQLMAGWKA
jgi:hypothetical protein